MILLDGILAFVLWLVDLTAWLEIKKENIKAKRLLANLLHMEDCELGEEFIDFVVDGQECKGFVTQPPDSGHCEVTREQGEPPEFVCIVPPPPPP